MEIMEYGLAPEINERYKLKSLNNDFKGLKNQILRMQYVDEKTVERINEEICYGSSYMRKYVEIVRLYKIADKRYYLSSFLK
ncbi:hypothetical protein P4283_28425 [Bacillus thuringiensis]|nr:hypothetical protein [Bacillus thuringiensis]